MKTEKRKSRIGSMLANLAGKSLLAAAAFALVGAATVDAQLVFDPDDTSQFGSWAEIGDPGNAKDTDVDDYGKVDYTYHIAKHAVSIADWKDMVDDTETDPSEDYDYWETDVGTSAPATKISMYQAAAYANWLTSGDMDTGAYTFDENDEVTAIDRDYRNANGMLYALPTEDEWYKAAYGDANGDGNFDDYSDYANGTDSAPDKGTGEDEWVYDDYSQPNEVDTGGGPEQNTTRHMMGNVWEWQEDIVEDGDDKGNTVRRGGMWFEPASKLTSSHRETNLAPTHDTYSSVGFRVVAIPEPASGVLFVLVGGLLWFVRRRARA